MRPYILELQIYPHDAEYCGSCPRWGVTGAENLCTAFQTRLKFYDEDLGCQQKGYQRCRACINHERLFEGTEGQLCPECDGSGLSDKTLPKMTCETCGGEGWLAP